jgi:hypothetical protein
MRPYTFNWKQLTIAICQLFVVLACSRKDEVLLPGGNSAVITFSAGSVREEWVDFNPEDVRGTRISDNAWTTGDAVGIYMLPAAVTDLTNNDVWKNKKHTVDDSGKLNPDGDVNTLYYPLNKSGVRFVAYYPYASDVTSTSKLTFDFADQSTKAKKESKDFCFHRGTTSYTSGTPKLGFKHKFSRILINLSKGAGGPSIKDVQVRLSGMPKTAEVNLNNFSQLKKDSFTVGADSVTVKAYTHPGSTDDAATVEAIVAPHSGTGKFTGREFTFTAATGEEKFYDLPDNFTFESGKVYTFNLEIASGITPQSPTKVSDGMTNCFIVAPGKRLKFYVSRAYTHDGSTFSTTLHTGGTYTGTFAAEVVWDDAAVVKSATVSGSGNSAIVTVKTAAAKSGNALVKICRSDNGETVWSYHIWVTDYTVAETYTNTDGNGRKIVFMDRNLGATKAGLGSGLGTGLFYQWGRKDPFPATLAPGDSQPGGGSFTIVTTSSSLGTIVNTIQNPGVFYCAFPNSSNDWHYAFRDNELWGHSGTKTIYDPCPSGWRVPVNYNMSEATSPWYGMTSTNGFSNGYNWGANALYPASGWRHFDNGSLDFIGSYGNYWSASPSSNPNYNVLTLRFNSGEISVNYNNHRGRGFVVRCVQE